MGIQNTKAQIMNQRNMYILRKNAALWQVVLKCSGKVQFSSLSKTRCNDWLESNFPDNESKK